MTAVANQKETAAYSKRIRHMAADIRLLSSHLNLFTALFVCLQRNEFNSPFAVNRRELMKLSKIASTATYHKCIKELDTYGYIGYKPSYHPRNGSLIYWLENAAESK